MGTDDVFVCGIAGGTCSGKSDLCHEIAGSLGLSDEVAVIPVSTFYKDGGEQPLTNTGSIRAGGRGNYDHPQMIDDVAFADCIRRFKNKEPVELLRYDVRSNARTLTRMSFNGPNQANVQVVLFEGIFALYYTAVRDLYDLALFVLCDDDDRLARRLRREADRGIMPDEVVGRWLNELKPSFDEFVRPTQRHADLVVPLGHSQKAVGCIQQLVRNILASRGILNLRSAADGADEPGIHVVESCPDVPLKMYGEYLKGSAYDRENFCLYLDRASEALLRYVDTSVRVLNPRETLFLSMTQLGSCLEIGARAALHFHPRLLQLALVKQSAMSESGGERNEHEQLLLTGWASPCRRPEGPRTSVEAPLTGLSDGLGDPGCATASRSRQIGEEPVYRAQLLQARGPRPAAVVLMVTTLPTSKAASALVADALRLSEVPASRLIVVALYVAKSVARSLVEENSGIQVVTGMLLEEEAGLSGFGKFASAVYSGVADE